MKTILISALFSLTTLAWSQTPEDARGGGWLHGGAVGEYFANADLSGVPSFTRRDVRVEFDWGTLLAPGGSHTPALVAVGADNFSVRWTGQVQARFAESYTFKVVCDDGARLFIKAAGGNVWTPLIDQWSTPGTHSAAFVMAAAATYDVRLEYRELTGAAACKLRWSSPSTPEEVVDSATLAALNLYSYGTQLWANAMDDARDQWGQPDTGAGPFIARDAEGWPLADAANIIWEGEDAASRRGVHLLQFRGRAAVRMTGTNVQFSTGATNHGQTLPFGAGYDVLTNTTTALVDVVDGRDIVYLTFTNTRRLPADVTATGVTEVKFMRPVSPDSNTPSAIGSIANPPLKAATERFAALRWILNFDTEQTWSQRVRPAYSTRRYRGIVPHWEYMVMMSNETGRDLYLCLPVRADDDYITSLAQLLRYGSDGVNPYTSEQAAPLYPPLNPNLRVYVERENEVWNSAFTNYNNNGADVTAAATANSADWQAVNYDGSFTANPSNGRIRWHALRTVRASQFFRSVFGDAAMGARVRPIYEYQYNNNNGTAQNGLTFLDVWFNNADGVAHVPDPHPVSYHLWGGGAAVYYSSGNSQGVQSGAVFANAGFETPALTPATVQEQPAGAAWTFTGTAGIYSVGATSALLGAQQNPPQGTQAAYIAGTGEMEQTVNFPTAGTYAMRMLAAAKFGNGARQENSVLFWFDGTNITPEAASHIGPSTRQWSPGAGFNQNYFVFTNYSTYVFHVTAPGSHTLRIQGLGIPRFGALNQVPDPNRVISFDTLDLVNSDALLIGIPGIGEANGQSATGGYENLLFTEQRYAQAYGLHPVAYEGGWSVGGDFAATAFQNWCKFLDPRARQAQRDSLDVFAQSGSRLYTFGTYDTWPTRSTATHADWPLAQGIDDHNALLPPRAIVGTHVPAVLTPALARWSVGTGASGLTTPAAFYAWTALVPATASYTLDTSTQAGGSAVLELDGATQGAAFATGGTDSRTVMLTAGLHTLRVRALSGPFAVNGVTISQLGAPESATLTSATAGNGRVTLAWPLVAGATNYLVRYGTAPGLYENEISIGNVTTTTLTGLGNGVTHYFSIASANAAGIGLASNELAATPLAPGQLAAIAQWEFTGMTGLQDAANVSRAPSLANTFMSTGVITRGPGLQVGYNQFAANTFASGGNPAAAATYAQTLADSKTLGQFYTFNVAPTPGRTLSLTRLEFRPYYQGGTAFGTAVAWSTDGVNFTDAPAVVGTQPPVNNFGSLFTDDLSGIAALQNVTSTVTLRIYVFGIGQYASSGLGGTGDDVAIFGSYTNLPTALEAWRTLHGLAANGSQDLATPANDGVANLLKFALNFPGAPATPADLTFLPTSTRDSNGSLRFTYLRRRDAAALGMSYIVEFSDTLANWSANPAATESTQPLNATWERVTVTDSLLERPKRFARLRVTVE